MASSNVVRLPVTKHHLKDEPTRPYRLWNANDRRPERWRCYSSVENAHRGAILEMRWAAPGFHLEVYDVRTWRHLGTYTSRIKQGSDGATIVIEFTKGDGHVIVKANER